MIRSIIAVIVACLIAGCTQQPALIDSNGVRLSAAKLKGHWLLFDYWAAWCENCKQAVPALNAFYAEHKNKKVMLFGVNDSGLVGSKLRVAMASMKIKYPVLQQDPASYYHLTAPQAIPALYVINPNGKLVTTLYGVHSQAQLDHEIKRLIKAG